MYFINPISLKPINTPVIENSLQCTCNRQTQAGMYGDIHKTISGYYKFPLFYNAIYILFNRFYRIITYIIIKRKVKTTREEKQPSWYLYMLASTNCEIDYNNLYTVVPLF